MVVVVEIRCGVGLREKENGVVMLCCFFIFGMYDCFIYLCCGLMDFVVGVWEKGEDWGWVGIVVFVVEGFGDIFVILVVWDMCLSKVIYGCFVELWYCVVFSI